MDTGLFIFIVCFVSGAVFILLGFLIGYKNKSNLINGVDFSKISDLGKFCRTFGNGLIVSGVFLALSGYLVYIAGIGLVLFLVLFLVFSSLPLVYFFYAKQKYAVSSQ